MVRQSRLFAAACAAFFLTLFGNSQSFAVTMTAAVGGSSTTCNSPGGTFQTGSTPASASVTCFDTGPVFAATGTAAASASAGHVGATVDATSAGTAAGIHMTGTAIYSDVFIFHSATESGNTLISLNLSATGTLNAGGPFAVASIDLRAFINAALVSELTSSVNTTAPASCGSSFSGGSGCGAGFFSSGELTTAQALVPLDQPVLVQLRLDADATASAPLSASSVTFGNSLDFPIGVALFNLDPGITVDAPDSFVTNNIFAPPGAVGATPLPATLPLFATGLGALGLLGWRRKKKERGRSLAGGPTKFRGTLAVSARGDL
jgi:hypothetical protein